MANSVAVGPRSCAGTAGDHSQQPGPTGRHELGLAWPGLGADVSEEDPHRRLRGKGPQPFRRPLQAERASQLRVRAQAACPARDRRREARRHPTARHPRPRGAARSCRAAALAIRRPRKSTGMESGPPTVATGTMGHPCIDRRPDEALAPASTARVALGPRPQRVDLATRPQRHVAAGGQRRGDGAGGRGEHAHAAEVGSDPRHRHQGIVRRPVQDAVLAESAATPG